MTFEVEVAGRLRTVVIERAGPGIFRIALDGRVRLVEAVRSGAHGVSLLRTGDPEKVTGAEEQNGTVSLSVAPGAGAAEVLVSLHGQMISARLNGRRAGHRAEPGAAAAGEAPIVAPMPGRVVRVLAAVGEEVAPRQGIVVVEAMKMENELRAPRGGRVREITVAPGASVEAGRILAVIE